ncbi:MAG: glycosyltransferase family 4 protein [Prochlorococcaceae cyanobacterium]|jgi:glycosyltransferase involved in cell wall biosynthesis
MAPLRLAVVVSHPIQYYVPWFVALAQRRDLVLRVFYLWTGMGGAARDPGFDQTIRWDLPLLQGYDHTFVPNRSRRPGSDHFGGLHCPDLPRQLRDWRADGVLLFGYAWRAQLQLLLDPRLASMPVLLRGDSHDLVPRTGPRALLARLVRRILFRRLAGALAVGEANRRHLLASGLPPQRIVLAPHAVDNDRFLAAAAAARAEAAAWRGRLGIDPTAPVVLFTGKFIAKKRPLDLLEAFLALDHPTAALVLVGAGPLETPLRQRLARAPGARVHLTGFVNQSAMPAAYALGDVIVLPSEGPGETWGLCINEAMNLGLPAIVSSHVGCGPDLVLPGRTGWVVPAGDRQALADTLAEALADPGRLKRFGEAARQRVAHYGYDATTAGLLQALALIRRSA